MWTIEIHIDSKHAYNTSSPLLPDAMHAIHQYIIENINHDRFDIYLDWKSDND